MTETAAKTRSWTTWYATFEYDSPSRYRNIWRSERVATREEAEAMTSRWRDNYRERGWNPGPMRVYRTETFEDV